MQQRKLIGWAAAAIAAALLVGAWSLSDRAPSDGAPPPVSPRTSAPASAQQQQTGMLPERTKGSPDAPLTVFEISDFQCPYCRVFWEETLPAMEREYIDSGKLKLVFLNLPLTQIHPNAAAAHEFAMCAAVQDRFWPAHDLLYRYQDQWARLPDPGPYFMELADSAGLAAGELRDCFNTGAVRGIVQQEAEMNFRSGISSTPSFVVEGILIPGLAPIEAWRPLLDSLYAAKTQGQ